MACQDCTKQAKEIDDRAKMDARTMHLLSEAASVIRQQKPDLTAALEAHVAKINAAGNLKKAGG